MKILLRYGRADTLDKFRKAPRCDNDADSCEDMQGIVGVNKTCSLCSRTLFAHTK